MTPWLNELKFTSNGEHVIPNTPLKGRAAVVLGGGPSLRKSIVSALDPYPTFCANNAFYLRTEPSLVVALDRRWFEWHGAALQALGHPAVTALRPGTHVNYRGTLYPMAKDREATFPETGREMVGTNSGHAAIGLAITMGATAVYLVGFDMGFPGGCTHWHEGHKVPPSEANYVSRFRPALEKLVTMAAQRGIHVASITETMAAIPTVSLQDAMRDLDEKNGMDNATPPTPLS